MADRLSREEITGRLRAACPVILPSLLLCDFANLQREVEAVEAAGAATLHFDVIDGLFAPNITYGMPIIESIRRRTELVLDVHLMITEPHRYLKQIYEAGADVMTIHAEAVDDPRPVLDQIRELGALAGLAINPPTPLSAIEQSLPHCDMVLAMSVMPGFGGQKFDQVALGKLSELRDRGDVEFREVDGGIGTSTIGTVAAAGANMFVTGAAIFRSNDYAAAFRKLRELASAAVSTG
jgi:ribulose-phosphate 3-epimerase